MRWRKSWSVISTPVSKLVEKSVQSNRETTEELKKSMESLREELRQRDERIAELVEENREIRAENEEMRIRIESLEESNHKLCDSNEQLGEFCAQQLDRQEQYSRRLSLRFNGLKLNDGESTDEAVIKVTEKVGVNITKTDISRSHVVGRSGTDKPQQIIAQFVSYRTRKAIISERRKLKSVKNYEKVYINEDLTAIRLQLLKTSQKIVREKNLHAAWSYDGNIWVSVKENGNKLLIRTEADLKDLSSNTPAARYSPRPSD